MDWSGEPDEAAYEEVSQQSLSCFISNSFLFRQIYEEIQNMDLDGRVVNNEKFSQWVHMDNNAARRFMFACVLPRFTLAARVSKLTCEFAACVAELPTRM